MNIEELRDYCLRKPHVFECFPFGEGALVFKVGYQEVNRMFALIPLEKGYSISLKCDPDKAVELRDKHREIAPAYHFNKKHWNSVDITGALADSQIRDLVDHSYDLCKKSLPKHARDMMDKS